jgi:MFS transporter, DHA2 family, multidrug resistance protein
MQAKVVVTMAGNVSRRWWALAAISVAVLAVTLDVTVLTVALPTLAVALNASEAQLQWFVTAYTLALVAGMLPAGLLGDRYGRRRLMVGSMLLFAAGSLACAYSPDPAVFIAARVALGLAGAGVIVVALSMLTVLFDEAERPRAIGIWGAANFIGLPLGPIVGGWLLTNVWWGWIFLLNVPVALVGIVAVVLLVPESRAAERPHIDMLGIVLSSGGLVLLMYGVVEAGDNGWLSAGAVGPALAGLVVLAGFLFWERRAAHPLVDLSLFTSRSFTWGVICTAFGVFGLFGVLFALPQYFQAIVGTDPQGSGLRLLPAVFGLIVGAVFADRIAERVGSKFTVALGSLIVVGGTLVGATLSTASSDVFVAGWTLVVGAGSGLAFATSASAALVELSSERAGVGSALLQAVVKLGPAFGASILGSALNATYQSHLDLAGLPDAAAQVVRDSVFGGVAVAQQLGSTQLLGNVQAAFVAGIDVAALLTAATACATVALALLFLPNRRLAAADNVGGG